MNTLGKFVPFVLVVMALAACTPKPADTAADEAALKADPVAWFEAYNAGDADGVAGLYAEDAMLMAPGAPPVSGRTAIREFISMDIEMSKARGLVMNAGEITGVGVAGDTGWLSGTFTVVDGAATTVDSGKFLSVYRRTANGWQLTRDIWNSSNPPPALTDNEPLAEIFAD
jgi:uncharacterized protein (TIGR02246 family)